MLGFLRDIRATEQSRGHSELLRGVGRNLVLFDDVNKGRTDQLSFSLRQAAWHDGEGDAF